MTRIDHIKVELTKAKNAYNSCVRLALCDSADGYRDEYVALQKELDTITSAES